MSPPSLRLPVRHESALVFRVGTAALALPLSSVEEILRPLPLEPAPAGAGGAGLGLATVRGRRIPVVALAGRLATSGSPTRWITLRAGHRRLALAADGVAGVLRFSAGELAALPPLVSELGREEKAALTRHAPRLLALLRRGWVLQTPSAEAPGEGAAR